MSLAEKLHERKVRLKHVSTVVTKTDGKKFLESNSEAGDKQSVEIGESYGFCVDNTPDEKLHCVSENLYISSQDGAHNYNALTEKKITHILNVATGVTNPFPKDFIYKTVEILDLPEENIIVHFPELFMFIEEGIKTGAILVHCNAGVSRSTTVIIAYLIKSHKLSLNEAFNMIKYARPSARPNDGFWKQLQQYEQEQKLCH